MECVCVSEFHLTVAKKKKDNFFRIPKQHKRPHFIETPPYPHMKCCAKKQKECFQFWVFRKEYPGAADVVVVTSSG